ncbi:UTRA domain-containing protein [Siculibacillus lacustris]|uniref:UTRA domain-containing protein n=1 Tax=Siculibacillus lacustris TaxID=1549641 RepID=A0A4Q9VZC7_9HYPH|nr:UTRA domain-containing protein [Siculibacillus lacustris]TBW41039.1 UTRA domain-containing protein [Siculibacillus lacustris]
MIDDLEDLDGQGPLWQQIRRALIRPITTGIWAPGFKIPKEFEIIGRYGAARMTVHRALRSLAAEGLLTRRRRFGTVVASSPPERPVLEIWDIEAEVARFSAVYSFEILERTVIDADDPRAAPLALAEGSEALFLSVRHFADGEPLQIERRLINLTAVPKAASESFTALPPGTWLIRNVAWSDAEHVIVAEGASPEMAQLLSVAAGSACLVVERRTWVDATPITWARLVHPGDKRRLVGRFRSAGD